MRKKRVTMGAGIAVLAIIILTCGDKGYYALRGLLSGECFYHGLPTSYWRSRIVGWDSYRFTSQPPTAWIRQLRERWWLGRIDEPSVLGGDPAAFPVLRELISDTGDGSERHQVRLFAIGALKSIGSEVRYRKTVLDAVGGCLHDPNMNVRLYAVAVLTTFGPEASAALGQALHDPERSVRLTAAQCLAEWGEGAAQALPSLMEVAATDSDEEVREKAALVVAKINSRRGSR
jgi:HEAT repeats